MDVGKIYDRSARSLEKECDTADPNDRLHGAVGDILHARDLNSIFSRGLYLRLQEIVKAR